MNLCSPVVRYVRIAEFVTIHHYVVCARHPRKGAITNAWSVPEVHVNCSTYAVLCSSISQLPVAVLLVLAIRPAQAVPPVQTAPPTPAPPEGN